MAFAGEKFSRRPFVVSYQNPVLGKSFLDNRIVVSPSSAIEHREDFVLFLAQPPSNVRAGAFVDKETHLRGFRDKRHETRAGQGLGCKQ